MGQRDFDFSVPVENRTEEVNIAGINETDVWLQQLNSLKTVVNKWERIPIQLDKLYNIM